MNQMASRTLIFGPLLLWLLSSPVSISSAQKITISGPATCQQGQTCTYTAKGGSGPYTFALVNGSVGSITPDGNYTAPAHVVPKQVINGCQATPNNSVFNTRIDALPVHANNPMWMANIDPGSVYYTGGERLHGSTVLSTDPSMKMAFLYTPQGNGPYIFVPFPNTVAESGTDIPGGYVGPPGRDEHVITTYRDTCKQQEVYQLYQSNLTTANPGGNSQSGVIYSLTNFVHPGYGTDAALTYISPLTVHLDELLAAEAGNLDAIQHAVRITEDAASIDASVGIWPAQPPGGYAACRGGQNWVITSDGSGAITGTGFNINWPAGMPVNINGANNSIASIGSPTSLTLTRQLKAGSFTMNLPHTDCAPYGARFRLKSSFAWPGFDGLCATQACRNVINALLRAEQRYGFVLADVGSNGNADYDGGQYTSNDIGNAFRELYTKLIFNNANFEAVDESALNTRQGGGAADQRWMEVSLTNGMVTPDGAAVLQVSDGAGNKGYYSAALQGVAIGVPNPIEVVMAGAGPIQFSPWTTGSSNTGYSCSLSGQRSAGAITSRCLYTPPSKENITTRTDVTVTVTAAADNTVTKTFQVTLLPVAADGSLYISLGKTVPAHTYTDNTGIAWWNDMPTDLPLALFPDFSSGGGGGVWTGANSADAPGIYTQGEMGVTQNDLHFPVWVPNGNVTGTIYMANVLSTAANRQSFSFDCNGNRVIGVTDLFTYTGSKGTHSAAPLTCASRVTNGMLHMVLRWQGVNLSSDSCCTQPVYHTGSDGVWAAGLMITPEGGPHPRPRTPAAVLPSFHFPGHFRLAALVLLLSMAIVGLRLMLRPSKR
jgi:hypothetical protein